MGMMAGADPAAANDFRLSPSQELCLDVVRICMAQLIVLGHFVSLVNYQTGRELPLAGLRVTVFFMLSGFLIFSTTWRRRDKGLTFREYMIERSARLWVCLVPALVFSALVAHLTLDLPGYPALRATGVVQFAGNLLMLEDYPLFQILRRVGLDSQLFIRPYASAEPYWTLPIELWLYVVFGYLFFYGVLRRGRPTWLATLLFGLALGAVMYHASTGHGQCLSLIWLIGALGPWAVPMERRLQARFGYSDRIALLLVWAWLGFWLTLIGLRMLSRGVNFYELQMALFVACILLGLLWLSGRIPIAVNRRIATASRTWAKQTYALYLTHNAVMTWYIAHRGTQLSTAEAAGLILACNVIAIPFYWLFDRHHRQVAQRLKTLRWLRLPTRTRASVHVSSR